ncbi:MAG: 4'-phosphopantetheinyl transferase superfamily protein [Acidobacteriota bacterium]|nr:4'-phosphopantetheinyl transferase superfamily protein [Acidobacteriota bacterium]
MMQTRDEESIHPWTLQAGIVDVWLADARARIEPLEAYRRVLSAEERERCARYRYAELQDFYTFSQGTLRRLLGRYLAVEPDEIAFGFGPVGKPFVVGAPTLQFNLSHSGTQVAYAFTLEAPLGVDIEREREFEDLAAVAADFFSPAEQQRLLQLPEEHRIPAFFQCWSRKEAVIKTTGEGVSRPLDSFEVAFGPGMPAALLRLDSNRNPGWMMAAFDAGAGYAAAVASPVPWRQLNVRRL